MNSNRHATLLFVINYILIIYKGLKKILLDTSVPVILNDVLRINFIFDSGASEVSISPDVALTLMRAGTISESDWLESQTYTFADGSKAKSKRFLIKKLNIGNQALTNIEASISNSIEAPMLIGQNVMNKLGSITFDYDNLFLIIKSK